MERYFQTFVYKVNNRCKMIAGVIYSTVYCSYYYFPDQRAGIEGLEEPFLVENCVDLRERPLKTVRVHSCTVYFVSFISIEN